MLSLRELRRAAEVISSDLAGAVLRRTIQTEDLGLALVFSRAEQELVLFLSCRPEFARVSLISDPPAAPAKSLSFAQYMCAHLHRSTCAGAEVAEADRRLAILFKTAEGSHRLILSIQAARTNIYLVAPTGALVHALRPIEETRRELALGAPWTEAEGILRFEGGDRWEGMEGADYLREVERAYRESERQRDFDFLHRRIETVLGREETFLNRKALNLQEDLADAKQAETLRRQGELLKSVLHAVPPGAEQVSARDFETGEEEVIPLDPTRTPAQNLEALFARYQKNNRGIALIEQQIESLQSERAALAELRRRAAGLQRLEADLGALRALAQEPRLRRLLARYYPARKLPVPQKKPVRGKTMPGRLQPRRFRTPDGLEVWVGRSDEGNDHMTTRLARGNDLFFHLEDYPGSHVILRTEGRVDPPPESVLAACELAVHFSRLKEAGHADVHMAHIKDVKKPKGAKPGLVYVLRGKTIRLRRDPKRLESILSNRLD